MITKDIFIKTMEDVKREYARVSEFNDALSKVCDGYPILQVGDGYLNSLLNVLNVVFDEENDEYSTIEWWLFEDVEKKIWITDKSSGKSREYDVSTPEALYDYLIQKRNDAV